MKIYITIDKVLYLEAFRGPYMWSVTRDLLTRRKPMPKGDWAMDSGGFGELRKYGKYHFSVNEYMAAVERLQPDVFFNMDWMCEPGVLKKTGMTIRRHQELSIENHISIVSHLDKHSSQDSHASKRGERTAPSGGPSLFAGVVQGWEIDQYLEHIDMMRSQGLITPVMGIGSVCRRNSEDKIIEIIRAVKRELPDVKLHGFGVKTTLIRKYPETVRLLDSIDSAAWGWMDGCWNAHGRGKNPYVATFKRRLEVIVRQAEALHSRQP